MRKAISLLGLVGKHFAWAGFAAYVEILWIMTLVNAFNSQLEAISDWIFSRRAIVPVVDRWEQMFAAVREWSALLDGVITAVVTVLGNLGAVVIVPVAWLAIGATVYGHQLRSAKLAVPGHEEATLRLRKIPNPVKRAAAQVTEPVVTPVKSAFGAIRKIAVAGVLPMVMFCIVFLVAGAAQSGVALVMHGIIGPGSAGRQFALEPFSMLAERGIYFVLVLSLVAAAVNAVVIAQQRVDDSNDEMARETVPDSTTV